MAIALDDLLPYLKKSTINSIVTPYYVAIRALYSYTGFRGILTPENNLSSIIHEQLCLYKFQGKLRGQWCHIPNEGRRSRVTNAIYKSIGVVSGVGDNVHVWPNGGGWIEIKAGKNKQAPNQVYFETICKEDGTNYAVVYSAQAYFDVLEKWGCLVP